MAEKNWMAGICYDPRQCPICGGADQHAQECGLNGKEHVRRSNFFEDIDWSATLDLNGMERQTPIKRHLLPWVALLA